MLRTMIRTAAKFLPLVGFFAALTATPATAHGEVTRRPLSLPVPTLLANALGTHYEIGRGAWDLGGISKVSSYSLAAFADLRDDDESTYLTAVVTAFTELTDQGRADDLAETCGLSPVQGQFDPIQDLTDCAAWHIERAVGSDDTLAAALVRLRARPTNDEALTYNQALDALSAYLFPVGARYHEVHSTGADYGLDFHTFLLVDRDREIAHLVRYDRGN